MADPEHRPTVWLRGLDGIRGIAACWVVLAHAITFLVATGYAQPRLCSLLYVVGTQALTMFFVLSGFLLYRPFTRAVLTRRTGPELGNYYRGRVLRVYPANVFIVLVAGLVLGLTVTRLRPGSGLVDVGRLTDVPHLLASLALVQGYFPSTVLTGLDASWSLVVEVMFYAILPALAWVAQRVARRWPPLAAVLVPAVALVVIGSVCRQVGYAQLTGTLDDYGPTWTTVFQRSFLANCDLLGWGMVVACLVSAVDLAGRDSRVFRVMTGLAWSGIVVGLLLVAAIHTDPYIAPFAGLACAGFIARVTTPFQDRVWRTAVRTLEWRPFRFLGEVSYSLYLWHFVVIVWVRDHAAGLHYDSMTSLVTTWLVCLGAAAALGATTYYLVEAPAMRLSKRLSARQQARGPRETAPAELSTGEGF